MSYISTHLLLSPMVLYNALTVVYLYERSLHMFFFFLVLFRFILCVVVLIIPKPGRLFYSVPSPYLSRAFFPQ